MDTVQRSRSHAVRARLVTELPRGIVAGLVGGLAFGAIMLAGGMLPMVAALVGSSSAVVGGVVHLAIAAGIGAAFALLVPVGRVPALLAAGLVYGAIWWVLGPLVIMPAWLGGELFAVDAMAVTSLVGHLVFGLVAAAVLAGLRRRPARA
ncbi:hypothetical protein OF117_05105 [Geodermatophilus sp. YIM 151500]|uniref:hypothetical protein n=1 Tax=Geodermatophilus sp. YIM 151500 TaxID=2984531 RepID=UPI0021E461FB|nr:hypothetical protein [Geodermatophilus sp. YIM 151500]MCV2488733.1 hypothetical protein [Geodermatophilus sp. YIM 151500]